MPDDPDSIVERWASVPAGSREQQDLQCKIFDIASDRIRSIVLRKLALTKWGKSFPADVDDICQTAALKLLLKLEDWKTNSGGRPGDFLAYASTMARNACIDLIRKESPEWCRMAHKIRYLVPQSDHPRRNQTDQPEFASWQEDDVITVCGFRLGSKPRAVRDRSMLQQIPTELRRKRDWSDAPPDELVRALLAAAAGPVPFEMLVDMAVQCVGIKGPREKSTEEEISPGVRLGDTLVDSQSDPAQIQRNTELIQWVWTEICDLSIEQRRVVCFNLDRALGLSIEDFEDCGVASRRHFATLLNMEPHAFATLSNRFPLDDTAIGARTGLSAEQVSNRRLAVRQRFGRRYSKFVRPKKDGAQ